MSTYVQPGCSCGCNLRLPGSWQAQGGGLITLAGVFCRDLQTRRMKLEGADPRQALPLQPIRPSESLIAAQYCCPITRLSGMTGARS